MSIEVLKVNRRPPPQPPFSTRYPLPLESGFISTVTCRCSCGKAFIAVRKTRLFAVTGEGWLLGCPYCLDNVLIPSESTKNL